MEDYQMPTGVEDLPAVQEHLLPYNTRCQKIRLAHLPLISKGKDVFTIYKYTKPRRVERTPILNFQGQQAINFQTKCDTFRTAMFPTPPVAPPAPPIPPGPTLQWPTVSPEEIASAIHTSAPNKAPGPDGMPFLLLQKAHQADRKSVV